VLARSIGQEAGAYRPAFARAAPAATPSFGARKKRWRDLELAIDLAEDFGSRRWWRGFATLTALTVATALMAPPFLPLPGGHPAPVNEAEEAQYAAAGIGALVEGSNAGKLLLGATAIAPGTSIAITLGRNEGGVRPIDRLTFRSGLDAEIIITGSPAGLRLDRQSIAVDATPLRIRGRVGDGLYWSLRAAGIAPAIASDYLKALGGQLDLGTDVAPNDRFDLVIANRRAATGENEPGALLYAGLDRASGAPLQLVRWTVGGSSLWYEASGVGRQVSGMIWPVSAPITSGFGERYHPILHFMRMHKGIDFGAHYGTPIVAAADGTVERAGWAGGYGEQVRLAHAGGIETSYSHMSRMVVASGTTIRQGQLIGYSGNSGLSTGPHLHYEVMRGGQAINPMSVRFIAHATLDGPSLTAFKARLASLLGVGARG
jgi:murein DD-endopeptidase MepM/ murein hydrolase activator NlpD